MIIHRQDSLETGTKNANPTDATGTFDLLSRLSGRWIGRGRGQYATIKPFEFSEETSFLLAPEYPMVRYEQRAWLSPAHISSHWELGLWRVVEDGEIELSNAQDSGRVEVMRGRAEHTHNDGLRIHLFKKCVANDPRLIATERIITLRDDTLHYLTYMTTTTTREPRRALHLEATLTRISPSEDGWIRLHREGFATRPTL